MQYRPSDGLAFRPRSHTLVPYERLPADKWDTCAPPSSGLSVLAVVALPGPRTTPHTPGPSHRRQPGCGSPLPGPASPPGAAWLCPAGRGSPRSPGSCCSRRHRGAGCSWPPRLGRGGGWLEAVVLKLVLLMLQDMFQSSNTFKFKWYALIGKIYQTYSYVTIPIYEIVLRGYSFIFLRWFSFRIVHNQY